ncbi:MAG: hypothetical protein AB1758_11440 [Candidatus Eremiobacterota bacterium]
MAGSAWTTPLLRGGFFVVERVWQGYLLCLHRDQAFLVRVRGASSWSAESLPCRVKLVGLAEPAHLNPSQAMDLRLFAQRPLMRQDGRVVVITPAEPLSPPPPLPRCH